MEWYASTTRAGNAAYFIEDPELHVVRATGIDGYTIGDAHWISARINADGMRGADLPSERDPSERWILCVGDSFTFGGGVETDEAWPQQMQAVLGPPEQSKVRVLNGGANGWDTPWQRLYLEKRGLPRFRPAVVVLGFNWNDLEITQDAPEQAKRFFIRCEQSKLLRPFARFDFIRESHLFRLFHAKVMGSENVPKDDEIAKWIVEYRQKRQIQAIDPELRAAEFRRRRFGTNPPDLEFWKTTDTPEWKQIREELTRIQVLCQANGTKFMVAMLPEPTWDGPGTFPAVERLASLLDSIGVPWVDVQPDFLPRPATSKDWKKSDLWLRYDPFHPTARGQRIFAEVIARKLNQLGWTRG